MKKAQIIWFTVPYFIFLVFFFLWFLIIMVDTTYDPVFKLGDDSFLLIDQVHKSDKMMFYLDTAAGYAAEDALAQVPNFGLCGSYQGVPLFNEGENLCFPLENFERSYLNFFKIFFQAYLDQSMDFDYFVYEEGGKLTVSGIAKGTKQLDLTSTSTLGGMTGTFSPQSLDDIAVGDKVSFYKDGTQHAFIKLGDILLEGVPYYLDSSQAGNIATRIKEKGIDADPEKLHEMKYISVWMDMIASFPNYIIKQDKLMEDYSIVDYSGTYGVVSFYEGKPLPENDKLEAAIIVDRARKYGIPEKLALAVAYQESKLDHEGNINPNSAGAIGIMQITPYTACNVKGFDPNLPCPYDTGAPCPGITLATADAEANIDCGLKILKMKYQTSTDSYLRAVEKNCVISEYKAKYRTYSQDPWQSALRLYNGTGCGSGADIEYVENVLSRMEKFS